MIPAVRHAAAARSRPAQEDSPDGVRGALFWAVLWRPRTRSGTAVAAAVGFITAASNSIAVLFAPLLALRVFALRRTRDHGVTAGWLAGCLVQAPLMVAAVFSGQSRLFGGFIATVVSVSLTPWEIGYPVTLRSEAEARYTVLPIFLIEAALIVGADHVLRRRRELPARPAAFLAVGWVADFRYQGARSAPSAHRWPPIVAELRHDCELSNTGEFTLRALGGRWTIPCTRLRC